MKNKTVTILGVVVPLVQRKLSDVRFKAPIRENSGRRGNKIVWDYVEYPSWVAASKATGIKKTALRWFLERR